MDKSKLYGTIIGVIAFIILLLSATYALYKWNSNTDKKTDINLTVSRDISKYINYNAGNSILETSNTSLEAGFDYTSGISSTIEFWKTTSASNKDIYGHLYLTIKNMKNASGTSTSDTNIAKTTTVKWAITTYNVNNTTETYIDGGNFYGKSINDVIELDTNFPLNSYQTYYKVYLWLDVGAIDKTNSVEGEILKTEISAEATDETK